MPDQLQLRGGTTAEHTSFTGASKEVTIDTTKKTAVVHDASTAGGNPLMREDGANCALIDGSAAAPALAFAGDSANTGIYSPGTDQIAVSTNGVERVEWGTSEVVFNDGGADYDFRVEGDTNQNLLFVDASTERIGMGTGSPSALLHISRTVNSGDVGLIIQNTGTSSNTASIYLNKGSGAEPDHRIQNDTGGNLTFASGTDESTYSEQLRIDSNGRLLVGTSSDISGTSNTSVQIVGSADNLSGELYLCRNDSTTASSNPIGTIEFRSNQGGTYESHARIQVQAEGGIGAGDKPGRMLFFTTPDGSATPIERMRITSTGNVGIGTTGPSTDLHVSKAASAEIRVSGTANGSDATIGLFGTQSGGGSRDISLKYDNSSDTYKLITTTANHITIDNSAGEAMRIDGSGNVGIGTTSPAKTLHVNGDIRLPANNTISWSDDACRIFRATDDLRIDVGGSERARIDSSGRLLVGTSTARSDFARQGTQSITPFCQIETATNSYGGLSVVNNSANGYGAMLNLATSYGNSIGSNAIGSVNAQAGTLNFLSNDGSRFIDCAQIRADVDGTPGNNDMPGRLVFSTTSDGASSPTERMRILSNGATKISTNGGYLANDAYHEMYQNNDGLSTTLFSHTGTSAPYGISIYLTSASPDNNTNYFIYAQDSTTSRFIVHSDGDVVNHDNSYGAISDEKLKQDIVDAGSQWDDLKNLRVRKFKFKSDVNAYGDNAKTLIGLVAQEAETVSPGLVKDNPDKDAENNDLGTTTKSINYSVLYMKAVKALQEAMERIETLEAKVAALEAN